MRTLVILFCSLLLLATRVSAEEPAELPQAVRAARSRAHFESGLAHFNLGEYDEAAREFETGYRYWPKPLFLFNIAQSAKKGGHPEKALEMYRRYLAARPDAHDRRQIEREIHDLETELARPATPEVTQPSPAPQQLAQQTPQQTPQQTIEPSPQPLPPPPSAPPTAPALPAIAPPPAQVMKPAPSWRRDWVGGLLCSVGAIATLYGAIDFGVTEPQWADASKSVESYRAAQGTPARLTADLVVLGVGVALGIVGAIRYRVVAARAR
jgi:tetratricopeptide (TPR) repeat protein